MKHEKEFKIPIPGTGKSIYAKQYGPLDQSVVIFVHGLTGHMDEHQFYNGARYFYDKGFSSVRFNLYDFEDDARNLIDCTLETHAEDIDTVTQYLKGKGAEKLFAVGHSYGGPSLLLTEQEHVSAIVLWDAISYDFSFSTEAQYIKEIDAYQLKGATNYLIGREMFQEAEKLTWQDVVKNAGVPTKLVAASNKDSITKHKAAYEQMRIEKNMAIIEGATHTFSEEGAEEKLFDETVNWFKKFT